MDATMYQTQEFKLLDMNKCLFEWIFLKEISNSDDTTLSTCRLFASVDFIAILDAILSPVGSTIKCEMVGSLL